MIRKEDIATIGQFAKPHGIKGELPQSPYPAHIVVGK